jgi:hypothetical protein
MDRLTGDTSNAHPSEDTLVAFSLGLLPEMQRQGISAHLETCLVCHRTIDEYREISAVLGVWREAPPEVVAAGREVLSQRIRLHRLLDQLFADADLRGRAGRDPEGLLTAHGITPTPEMVAAFKDLGLSSGERFPGELDERITKIRRLIEFFPGAEPGPLED